MPSASSHAIIIIQMIAIVVVCETHKEINGVQFLRESDQNGLYNGIRLFSCLFYYMYRVKKIR